MPTNRSFNLKAHQSKEGEASKDESRTIPSISSPKGGGAILGMGEKFAATTPVSGTGSMRVPSVVSPARSDFGPQRDESYRIVNPRYPERIFS